MRIIIAFAIGAALAACGDDSNNKARDAAVTDGTVADSPPLGVDAAPEPVTITITNEGVAASGVTVYFQNADSSLVAETMTDGSGTASKVMVAGGYVTALVPDLITVTGTFQNVSIDTFAGVKPGDHLLIEAANPDQQLDVSTPLDGTDDSYTLFASCDDAGNGGIDQGQSLDIGSGVADGDVDLAGDCTTADFTVWADGSSGTGIAYAAGVPITADLNLTTVLSNYVAPSSVAVSLTDIPSDAFGVGFYAADVTPHGHLFAPQSQVSFTAGSGATPASGSGSIEQYGLTGAHALNVTVPSIEALGGQQIFELTAGGSAYSIDVGSNLLHEYTTSPTISGHTVTWAEGSAGVTADLEVVDIDVSRDPNEWNWTMAAPHDGVTATFPTLPTDIFDYNPAAGEADVDRLDTAQVPGGYDAVRAIILSLTDPTTLLSGATGKAVHEGLQAEPSALSKARRHRKNPLQFVAPRPLKTASAPHHVAPQR